jgi:antitoxin (DNA-binding transcriptional repressor) of toxin-antitoxin stability system
MHEAKSSLSRLVAAIETGVKSEIIIDRDGRSAARLVQIAPGTKKRIGVAAEKFPLNIQQSAAICQSQAKMRENIVCNRVLVFYQFRHNTRSPQTTPAPSPRSFRQNAGCSRNLRVFVVGHAQQADFALQRYIHRGLTAPCTAIRYCCIGNIANPAYMFSTNRVAGSLLL